MPDPSDLALGAEFPTPSRDQWAELVDKVLKGSDFDRVLVSKTRDDIEIQPLYTGDGEPRDDAGFPGAAPFVRGASATATAASGWEIRQAQVDPDPKDANTALLHDLEEGGSGVLLRLDEAGRRGLAADDDRAADLIGRDGIAIQSRDDLAVALSEVLLDIVPVSFEPGVSYAAVAEMFSAVVAERGTDPDAITGCLGADPLAAAAATGVWAGSPPASLADLASFATSMAERFPSARPVQVSTAPYAASGATEAQEVAIMAATGVAYLRCMADAEIAPSRAAGLIELSVTVNADQFVSIAKLRAARRVWGRVLDAAGAVASPEAARPALRLHATMDPSIVTRRDPYVNMLRSTVACFSAAAGGADAITLIPHDAALGVSSDLARRIARNTHLILREESSIGRVIDPAGGSWFVDHLTEQLAREAWQQFQEIERAGGMVDALSGGLVHERIAARRAERDLAVATRRRALTGVSEFPELGERLPATRPVDPGRVAAAARQRAERARAAGVPLVEVASRHETDPLPVNRQAEAFETLRDAADRHADRAGQRPQVFLANLGPVAEHTARATFASNFFATGGIESIGNDGFPGAGEAASAFEASGARVAVICSSDRVYDELAEPTAKALREAGAERIYLAGRHEAPEIDEQIRIGTNVVETLRSLHELLEVAP